METSISIFSACPSAIVIYWLYISIIQLFRGAHKTFLRNGYDEPVHMKMIYSVDGETLVNSEAVFEEALTSM